jgi:hypothetical protein
MRLVATGHEDVRGRLGLAQGVKLFDEEEYADRLHECISIGRASEHGDPVAGKGLDGVIETCQHDHRFVE